MSEEFRLPHRLWLVAHAATSATERSSFPGDEPLSDPTGLRPVQLRVASCLRGPELRCRQTAAGLRWDARAEPQLADLDAGRWTGRGLAELIEEEPEQLRQWLSDPAASPHGGESITDVVDRVGAWATRWDWPAGTTAAVVSPMVVRAAYVHLLGAPPAMVFSVHVEPLSALVLGYDGRRWQLRSLGGFRTWSRPERH